jgi:WD40 repeat protein
LIGTQIALLKINRARLELKEDLYAAHMRLASEALRAGALDQVKDLLNRHRSDHDIENNAPFEWRYLRHASDQSDLITHQFQGLKGTPLSHYSGIGMSTNILFNLNNRTDAIRAWEIKTWEPRPLKVPSGSGTNWMWFPQQQAAISASDGDKTVSVYRLPNFAEAAVIKIPGKPIASDVSPGFQTVAIGFESSDRHHILLWDLVSNAQSGVEGNYTGRITRLQFSTDGTVLAVACNDGLVELWSIPEARTLPSPPAILQPYTRYGGEQLCFMPGSTRLYLNRGRERSMLESWDWNTRRLVSYQVPSGHVTEFDVSSDGALVAVGTSSGTIALLETTDLRQVGTISYNGAAISCLKFSLSSKLIASGSTDSSTRLWDVKTMRQVGMLGGNVDRVVNVAFTPDQKSVLTFSGDAMFKVWDLSKILGQEVLLQTTNHLQSFALSRDQTRIAGKDILGQIFVWDMLTGKQICRVPTGELDDAELGSGLSYSPTDQFVAWTGWNRVGLVDCNRSLPQIQSLDVPRWGFCNPAFSPDGREFAFATSSNIVIWDTTSGAKKPFAAVASTVFGLAYSPDGTRLATSHAGGEVILWDRKSGTSICTNQAHKADVFEIAFSPNGRLLGTASAVGTGKLWDIVPGGLRLRYELSGNSASSLTFSPDGKRVLGYNDADRFIKLWDPETGLEVATIYGNPIKIFFSRDGSAIYSVSEDGIVRTWEAPWR